MNFQKHCSKKQLVPRKWHVNIGSEFFVYTGGFPFQLKNLKAQLPEVDGPGKNQGVDKEPLNVKVVDCSIHCPN